MRSVVFASSLFAVLTLFPAASSSDNPMAGYVGNTSISIDNQGNTRRFFYRADNAFSVKSGTFSSDGTWAVTDGKLCLTYEYRPQTVCVPLEPHQIGDVWLRGGLRVTLVPGRALTDTPEVLAALAAASRVGNTVVAKDPDGTETRLYWRPDHSFTATRPGWRTEGTWTVRGSSLLLHYNIPRPNMGSDEEMKNATPRKVGEVWGMADRSVTLVAGEQLK